jgi:transcriptional regulator with XRE-family HTH domain
MIRKVMKMIKIKELRLSVGLTQSELAEKLNVLQSTVAMWESGDNTPRTEKLPELAEILKCTIDDLFDTRKA